jgi:hypothetical protein
VREADLTNVFPFPGWKHQPEKKCFMCIKRSRFFVLIKVLRFKVLDLKTELEFTTVPTVMCCFALLRAFHMKSKNLGDWICEFIWTEAWSKVVQREREREGGRGRESLHSYELTTKPVLTFTLAR